jgi:hypothetical protein
MQQSHAKFIDVENCELAVYIERVFHATYRTSSAGQRLG